MDSSLQESRQQNVNVNENYPNGHLPAIGHLRTFTKDKIVHFTQWNVKIGQASTPRKRRRPLSSFERCRVFSI